jgi:hypothetical protein
VSKIQIIFVHGFFSPDLLVNWRFLDWWKVRQGKAVFGLVGDG